MVWVTIHQLLVDYQQQTKRLGPASTGPRWIDPVSGDNYSYKQHVQWFYLLGLGKSTDNCINLQQMRPSSHVLAFWCGAMSVAMSLERLGRVDDHYRKFTATMPARQIERDLGSVP